MPKTTTEQSAWFMTAVCKIHRLARGLIRCCSMLVWCSVGEWVSEWVDLYFTLLSRTSNVLDALASCELYVLSRHISVCTDYWDLEFGRRCVVFCSGIVSSVFTQTGEGFYLLSPSEMARFSVSAHAVTRPCCVIRRHAPTATHDALRPGNQRRATPPANHHRHNDVAPR